MNKTKVIFALCFLWLSLLWPADRLLAYRDLVTGTFLTRDPAGMLDGPNLYAYVRQNPWTAFDPEGLSGRMPIDGPAGAAAYFGADGSVQYSGSSIVRTSPGLLNQYNELPNRAEAALYNYQVTGNTKYLNEPSLRFSAENGLLGNVQAGLDDPRGTSAGLMGIVGGVFSIGAGPRLPVSGEMAVVPGRGGSSTGQAEAEIPVSKQAAANENPSGKSAQTTSLESASQSESATETVPTTTVSPQELVSRQGPSEMTGNKVNRFTKDMKANGYGSYPPVEYADVDGRKIIIDGHHRTEAARKAGIQQIPATERIVSPEEASKLGAEAREAAAERAARRQ